MKFLVCVLLFSSTAFTKNIDMSFITRIEGDVRILSFPKRKAVGSGPHVKFKDRYYKYRQAKLGEKVFLGSVVQTGPKSKVRLVFENGDYITLSEGSSFTMKRIREDSILEVYFGKVRTVLKKDGELSGLKVKTRSMAMGVRGTDFYVETYGNQSKLSVLRGAVSVSHIEKPAQESIVEKGFSAYIDSLKISDEDLIKIKRLEKGEIIAINTHSSIKSIRGGSSQGMLALTEDPITAKIKALEKKALENTLSDVKEDDEELYKSLKSNKGNVDELDKLQKKLGDDLIQD